MKEKEDSSPIRCATVAGPVGSSDLDKWKKCKKILVQKLVNLCHHQGILEVIITKIKLKKKIIWGPSGQKCWTTSKQEKE